MRKLEIIFDDGLEHFVLVVGPLLDLALDTCSNLVEAIEDCDARLYKAPNLKHIMITIKPLPNGMPEIRVSKRIIH